MYYTDYNSPIGKLRLVSDGSNLTALEIKQSFDNATERKDLPIFIKTTKWLDIYFSGNVPPKLDINLKPKGNEFRQEVWKMLRDIPYGETTTYGTLAKRFNRKMSAQAIGGAVGHNPIAIIIPCHRVVGAGGKLTGYAAGLSVKEKLLRLEGIIA